MITINKNLQEQTKDKDYAKDVLMAELRINYDSIKTENLKLKDSLETQQKLWKIWLETFEKKKETNTLQSKTDQVGDEGIKENRNNDQENKGKEKTATEEEVEIIDNTEEDEMDSEQIFQTFVNNKNRGFKRTSPTASSSPNVTRNFKCEKCDFNAIDLINLNDHVSRVHGRKKTRVEEQRHVRENSPVRENPHVRENLPVREQENILYCHFWNNRGSCNFEERNGRRCKFEHKTAPQCKHDGDCNRKSCMFTHLNQNMDFLGNRNRGSRTPPPPAQPWQMIMEMLGLPRMNGRSGMVNPRRY